MTFEDKLILSNDVVDRLWVGEDQKCEALVLLVVFWIALASQLNQLAEGAEKGNQIGVFQLVDASCDHYCFGAWNVLVLAVRLRLKLVYGDAVAIDDVHVAGQRRNVKEALERDVSWKSERVVQSVEE